MLYSPSCLFALGIQSCETHVVAAFLEERILVPQAAFASHLLHKGEGGRERRKEGSLRFSQASYEEEEKGPGVIYVQKRAPPPPTFILASKAGGQ